MTYNCIGPVGLCRHVPLLFFTPTRDLATSDVGVSGSVTRSKQVKFTAAHDCRWAAAHRDSDCGHWPGPPRPRPTAALSHSGGAARARRRPGGTDSSGPSRFRA